MKKIFFSWALMAVTVVFMTACATKSETNEVNNFPQPLAVAEQ